MILFSGTLSPHYQRRVGGEDKHRCGVEYLSRINICTYLFLIIIVARMKGLKEMPVLFLPYEFMRKVGSYV